MSTIRGTHRETEGRWIAGFGRGWRLFGALLPNTCGTALGNKGHCVFNHSTSKGVGAVTVGDVAGQGLCGSCNFRRCRASAVADDDVPLSKQGAKGPQSCISESSRVGGTLQGSQTCRDLESVVVVRFACLVFGRIAFQSIL